MKKPDWIDTRLNEKEMKFLWNAVSTEQKKDTSNISKIIEDKDNWFYENVLKKHIERLFYDDWNNYRKYVVNKEEPSPKFEMNRFWVNYQRQYEFNPLHFHSGLYSFVIFMKIPTHWKEQQEMNKDKFRASVASDFVFVWGSENMEQIGGLNPILTDISTENLQLSLEDEGRMVFFPARLQHMVYPFYECEEERVTISGNIDLVFTEEQKVVELSGDVYKEKENTLKMMEKTVKFMKEDLKQMKQNRKSD